MRLNIKKFKREWLAAIITKLLFSVIFLVCATAVFIYVFFPNQLEKQSLALYGEKVDGITATMETALSRPLNANDIKTVNEILNRLSDMDGLEYLVIVDKNNQVYASLSLPMAERYNYTENQAYKSITADCEIYTMKRNITNNHDIIGTLYAGFSLDDLNAVIGLSRKKAIGIGLLSLMIGLIIVMIAKHYIVSPIKRLNKDIQDIAAGNLAKQSDIQSMDEIGELAQSVNAMINNWQSTQHKWGKLNKGLEQRVAERTKKLEEEISERTRAEEELRFYMAKLENSNRELQDFAFVASHDLQEPLRKVQAFGDRLKAACGDELSEKASTYLERMQSAAERMQVLIRDLLTFSRVTSKARPFEPVELKTIAQEVLSDLEVTIERLNGQIEIGDIPNIEADSTQMRQLIQNLIGNALKFHKPDEAPVVKVYSEILKGRRLGERDGREFCQFVVEDNGIGFDEKYTEKIFAVFQRLHGRSEYEGTGLGLAVCRKIVERHGGTISAKSTPGHGAKFYITLPLTQDEVKIPTSKTQTEAPEESETEKPVEENNLKRGHGMETSFMVPCP